MTRPTLARILRSLLNKINTKILHIKKCKDGYMKRWIELSETERNELIAEKVMGWYKYENNWYRNNQLGMKEGPLELPSFSSDQTLVYSILEQFDTYQITKMFPLKYRTIIRTNANRSFADTLNESVCLAALKARGIDI